MGGVPLCRGPIGRHLQQWTIHQPHPRFRPNITAATPSGSGNSPVRLRQPRSRSIYAQWRSNTSGWPSASITAPNRPTPEGCRSGGERSASLHEHDANERVLREDQPTKSSGA
jgi:hypothetical protein